MIKKLKQTIQTTWMGLVVLLFLVGASFLDLLSVGKIFSYLVFLIIGIFVSFVIDISAKRN